MNNKIIFVLITLMAFNFFSCKKFLDEKSDKKLVVPQSVDDLQGLLDDDYVMSTNTPGFGQSSDDDLFMTPETYNAVGEIDRLVYTWRLKDYKYPNDWAFSYNAIYNSNYVLDNIDQVSKTLQNERKWNNAKGSAFFFRGFYFLNLIWEYGKAYDESTSDKDLGIVLRLHSDFNAPSVRANVRQCYDQIISDLKNAAVFLPDNPIHPMRPSRAASYGALARTYLSMRKYDSALKYSDLSLKIKSDLLDYNSPDVQPSSQTPFLPFNPEIVFYTTQSVFYGSKFTLNAFADTTLLSGYVANDLRRTTFYFEQGSFYSFKGHYTANPYTFFSGIATDEVLLMRAECNARMGRLTEALSDVNNLLEKRWVTGTYVPFSSNEQSEVIDWVLLERRRELTMRGLRWIDIKRLNKDGANINLMRKIGGQTFELPANDNRYALPIPKDIIDLTGIAQN